MAPLEITREHVDQYLIRIRELEAQVALLKTQYRCYSCKQVFNEDHGHGLAREHFGSAYRGDLPKCCEVIDGKATWGGGYHDPFYRVRKDHYDELVAARPRKPTEAMLNAARDWSQEKYGKPIGNDAAIGCWQAMLDAAPKSSSQAA